MDAIPPFDAESRRKFGSRQASVSPVVGVLAVLGATYLLSSPIPALLGAGAFLITRRAEAAKKAAEAEKAAP